MAWDLGGNHDGLKGKIGVEAKRRRDPRPETGLAAINRELSTIR
jgi:hypothetical protein